MTDAIVVLCTCPDQTSADLLCEQLLNQRLAACINQLPG
ncbi:MAG: divalent cation tolerance protein CutA, partial [Aeromonas veronii]